MGFINYSVYSPEQPPYPPDAIRAIACQAAFGGSLITNNFRGLVAEAIVRSALPSQWRWCSADYAGWDFERADGVRLEVKQSAAKQTWARSDGKPSVCSFDIRSREGRYEGADWLAEPGRSAHLYVFTHHPVTDENADHCNPRQWRFFVVPTERLPEWKRIGVANLASRAEACLIEDLARRVELVADQLPASVVSSS